MKLLFTIIILTFSYWSFSQCSVTIQTASDSVDCGECFDLVAVGVAQDTLLGEDFNNNSIGAGWSSTSNVLFNNPCGPSLDGSPSAWFGDVPFPRTLTTNAYDVTCGGDICFDLRFAADDGGSHCEDPDLPNEGVYLDYSIDGGTTWIQINYFQPTSNKTGPYYTWANYCFPIPAAAQTTSTMFRWSQPNATATVNDHWGIDNVAVLGNLCNTYYYDWFADGSVNSADTTLCLEQNTDNYNVIFTDGISDTCHADIDMFSALHPNLPNDTSICGFIDIDLVSTPTGGSGNYNYQWSNGDTDSITQNVTTDTFYIDIQDVNYPGCTASDTTVFEMYPNPDVNFSADPLCQGYPTFFEDLTDLPPGYNVNEWSWNFDNQGATSTDENPSHEFTGVGTYNVTLSVVSDGGCVGDTTITFFVEPAPFAKFEFDDACEDEEIFFENQSVGSYENSHWVFATDTDTVYSEDASYTFSGSGDFDVTLFVEDINGECVGYKTETVTVHPLPDLSFTADPMTGEPVLDVEFYNDPSGLIDNLWDFADGDTSTILNDTVYHSFEEAGVYNVVHTGTSPEGCTNSYSLEIIVEHPEVTYTIPNIITPNNDGVNDGFYINYKSAEETIIDFEIVFLNRWGNVINSYTDHDFVWDGTNNAGNKVNDGTYFYKVKFNSTKGESYEEHGFVQVVNE